VSLEPAKASLPTGFRFDDRYEIQGELGSGSFGRVYRARQLSTGQSVAIKLLAPREGTEESTAREVERFRRETRICADLSHTNIVGLIDSGATQEGQLYAVFAYVPGETLEQALSREGALGVRESVRLFTQVLEALACAHAKGIVHRDLKPSNFMLSGTPPRRNAVVLDFGLGGLAEGRRRKEWETLTQTREFLGTPLYASPEQLAGEKVTPRSDLYTWGLIFLECLTGRHPFTEAGAAARLLTGGGAVEIPEWLRGHRLGALLEAVTVREAEKRDVSVEALIEALEAIAREELPEVPVETRLPAPLSERGERRHLTVMFCDLVGSSALAQRLAAEAYRRVVQAYHARAAQTIARYEGHVAQYLGDGLLVYFGYPQAHEDDAERAVRAGRDILRELQMLNPRLEAEHGVRLQARVGIHAGPAVVGPMGRGETRETLALGDTSNVAARLEGFAEPDTVVISDALLRLVPGLFVTEDRGTPALKGISVPIRAYRVLQRSGVASRLDRAPRLTPFVGREQELGLLLDRFEQAEERRGQAVLIAGEAGIGKSRLVHRFRERLREARTPYSWLECRSSPYTRNSALYPVIELVEQALRSEDELSPDEKVERLERNLALAGLEPAETVPLLASLLLLRLPDRYAPLEISPQLQRQKTLEALLSWVLALGEKQPVVLLVEDLHWADPSTLEWLGLLIEQCATASVLLLLTFRPDFEVPWQARSHLVAITLSRLSRRQAKELVAAAAREALPGEVVDRLAARSDGIPLFVEELAKDVVESGRDLAGSRSGLAIPETLQDSLMARLDRLGDAKQVAQLGAALGREFPYALLEAVAPLKELALREGLGRLVEAELVYQRGLPPKATYTFKHALVQDTAYQSLLESQRRELHGRIADALEKHFPERVAREPEAIARHCEAARRPAQAIGHYQRAGERAIQASANEEAIGQLRRALELLATLPEPRERARRELDLQMAIAGPLGAARGWAHPECEGALDRARALVFQVGELPERARVLGDLTTSYYIKGDLTTASELARQALEAAERAGGTLELLMAHSAAGDVLYFQGEYSRSLHHLEESIGLSDLDEHAPLAHTMGHDRGVVSRAFASWCHVQLGHPDRGLAICQEAVALARRVKYPPSLALALALAAVTHRLRREPSLAQEHADEAIALAEELRFPLILANARYVRGWARAWAQGGGEAVAEIQQALAEMAPIRARVAIGAFVALAEACWKVGRRDDALGALGLGVAQAKETGAHFLDAELHCLRAEILLDQDRGMLEEAESLLRRALEIARGQEAKWFELRAATSLARLLRYRGRRDEARALLHPIYAWFTEGFDTVDLKDAKALLGQLGR
jgi:TOMM system kinase/cyclase fusion protein